MSSPAIMQMLQSRVSLTLLLDLVDADRLPSESSMREEVADLSWLRAPPLREPGEGRADQTGPCLDGATVTRSPAR